MKKYRSFAVIVYVTDTEKQAVMRMFDWTPLRIEGDEQEYGEAFLEKDGRRLRVVSAQQDEMGMTASAALTTKMICHFTPEYVIMPGIAAGIGSITDAESQEFGDVLLADSVCDFADERKNDNYQKFAAYTSCGFIKALLEKVLEYTGE